MDPVKQQLRQCLDNFRAGNLTEQDLLQALETANRQIPQRLLYLQSESTMVTDRINGMSIVDHDGIHDGPDDPDDWPYQTVHEAILDGWRIIKFPEMALMTAGEETTYGLGCEFILAK